VGDGLPRTHIVGLPDSTVRESQERLVSAFKHSGIDLPDGRIVINLSPTDLRKTGSHYDLPIAAAVALASGRVPRMRTADLVFLGELALDGSVRPVPGVLPAARWARGQGVRALVVPEGNAREAAAGGVAVWPVASLWQMFRMLWEGEVPEVPSASVVSVGSPAPRPIVDLADVRGQLPAKRGLEVAASGGHNLLFVGPPGSGKTLLARGLSGLLPALGDEEAIEATCIHSAAGLLRPGHDLLRWPPFRAPHHTASATALLGGGTTPKPGEVTLAHHGVLFLDELPEFRRDALEGLRQPLEENSMVVSRARYTVRFPARFTFLAAMNPCPCGHAGDPLRTCRCTPSEVGRYRRRVSGPLLDRIDLQMQVPRVRPEDLSGASCGESTRDVAGRVLATRERQLDRQGALNAHLGLRGTEARCAPRPDARRLLEEALERFGLSARAYHRILRVARTLADMESRNEVEPDHVAEALQYRVQEDTRSA